MIYSPDYKFIFFANSKTGTTSLENVLQHHDVGKYHFSVPRLFGKKHIPPSIVRALMPPEIWDECYKFTFTRNPYDWFVSQWFHNFRPYKVRDNPVSQWVRDKKKGSKIVIDRPYRTLLNKEVFTVDDVQFLYKFLRQRCRTLPQHDGKYQICYILDSSGNKIVDFVGRFESLEEDYAKISDRIGLVIKLPHLNKTNHREYWNYLTPESANMIYDLWRVDFENLGYPKQYHPYPPNP